jgi:glycosyltransferase involved in cell wall biosynthesis
MTRRVILFLPSMESGGVERNAVYFANGMVNRGFEVHLFYCRKQDAWFSKLDHRIRKTNILRRLKLPLLNDRISDALNMLLFGTPALHKLAREQQAVVVSFQSNVVAILLALMCRIPIAVRLSNHFESAQYEKSTLRKWSELAKRLTYRYANRVIANSSELARDYERVLGREVDTIPNGIEFSKLEELQKEPVPEPLFSSKKRPIIIAAGRLVPQKNYSLLLRAMPAVVERVPCDLVILGEGDQRRGLEQLVRELSLVSFVHLLGHRSNVYRYFRRSDLFVLTSNYEGMPNALIEAIACGLPVIATRCKTGPAEILCDGSAGELIPVGNEVALANAIVSALQDRRSATAKSLIAASHIRRYDLPLVEDAYVRLVAEMLPNP